MEEKPLQKLSKTSYIIFSFLITAFGQPAWSAWASPIAAIMGYGLFWYAIAGIEKRRFWLGTLWFMAVQLVQLSWMTSTEYQGVYILGVWLVVSFLLGAQFGFLTLYVHRLPFIATAGLWTLFEWARCFFFCGFSWNPVGLSLTAFESSLQMASLFGIFGLSFYVILTNVAFLHQRKIVWAALALFPYVFGFLHINYHDDALKNSETISVALIQPGLYPAQKIPILGRENEFISPYQQWANIFTVLKEKRSAFDMIVLPEYAVPLAAENPYYMTLFVAKIADAIFGFQIDGLGKERFTNLDWMRTVSQIFSADVVMGLDSDTREKHFASAFHLSPQGKTFNRYEKQILVPLAEYVPFSFLKSIAGLYGITEFFTHGTESKVFQAKQPFSISVCYEETFPDLVREGRVKGAELFVNLTNDGWYPNSKLPLQQFHHGRIRSVENGVPLVRACNTGVTVALDSLGRTLGQIESETESSLLHVHLPIYHYKTLYTIWGNFGIVFLSLLFLIMGVINYLRCSEIKKSANLIQNAK